eukprot:TRINITY_DN12058_c0_g1_i1.p1 TRINITY_DN12058_c0_g1~~TRINITY_DN12058_c0_g1_i1.p1  ORF type:complete len:584 (+),score=144.93 TRINITY_DN12058_c0_g1_i1:44-1753(+)
MHRLCVFSSHMSTGLVAEPARKSKKCAKTNSKKEVYLVASGDLRLSANQVCWAKQAEMEEKLTEALASKGWKVIRAHKYNPQLKHGFLDSQRHGLDAFASIPISAPVIAACSVWQYSHHVLPGLRHHLGPILTVANFDGTWPGLVGMLNLNAGLTKACKPYSTLWSVTFDDKYFLTKLEEWLTSGKVTHDESHVRDLLLHQIDEKTLSLAHSIVQQIKKKKIIMGVFDEGCMGMYNAIFDDELLNQMFIFKERLSQSALLAAMRLVTEEEAMDAFEWLKEKGMTFHFGKNEKTELTESQVLNQMTMYIAAIRIAFDFGCDIIGIQYQQGLKDMCCASDLAEGLFNNVDRPPVYPLGKYKQTEPLFDKKAMPHFNEVDEGACVDAIITNRCCLSLGLDPATTLHDIRWGEYYKGNGIDAFVWVFLISGAVPPSHFAKGYKDSHAYRQTPMYFPLGGATLQGVSKPGEIVWSRVFQMNKKVHADIGRGTVVDLPAEETQRRLKKTNPEWPIMSAVLHGVTRDQMMSRHKANHIQVVYGNDAESADKLLAVKAAVFANLGIEVHICGDVKSA